MSDTLHYNFKNATYSPPTGLVNFNFVGVLFNIIGGHSNNFVSIWADEHASRTSAKMYVASTGSGASLSIVDLSDKILVDNYTISVVGAFGESLDKEDISDINIGSRG